jgi:antitoxin component YwqK of YwqJK toxin-antitoxin module
MIVCRKFLKVLLVITCALEVISCGGEAKNIKQSEKVTRFPDGKIKERIIKVNTDSIDFMGEQFYPSGSIESRYSLKNGLLHGYYREYYQNGKISFEGLFVLGRKKGSFKYYDSTERLQKIINFINYQDSSVSRPNEVMVFDEKGDTVFERSYFYNFYSVGDTLRNISDKYHFKVVSRGKLFKYSYIVLCNFDDKFKKVGSEDCDATLMEKNEIMLSPKNQKTGMNFVRGYILNTEKPLNSDGTLAGKAVEMYFSEKYYVVP